MRGDLLLHSVVSSLGGEWIQLSDDIGEFRYSIADGDVDVHPLAAGAASSLVKARETLGDRFEGIGLQLGMALMHAGRYDAAIEAVAKLRRRKRYKFYALNIVAQARYRLGNYAAAGRIFETLSGLSPESPLPMASRAHCLRHSGRYAAALRWYERAAALEGAGPADVGHVVGTLVAMGRPGDALSWLRDRLKREGLQEAVRDQLRLVERFLDTDAQRIDALKAVIESDANDAASRRRLAYVYVRQRDWRSAAELLAKLPNSAATTHDCCLLAACRTRTGDWDGAVRVATAAVARAKSTAAKAQARGVVAVVSKGVQVTVVINGLEDGPILTTGPQVRIGVSTR